MTNPDIQRIAYHYGAIRQFDKLMRECIELADAVNHYTEGKCDERDVFDEIADVEIMLEQAVYLLSEDDGTREIIDAREIVDSIKEKKIARQIRRIEWE